MSLLLQALQKAARNREQASAAASDPAAAAPTTDNRSMLELEPGEFDPGRGIGQDPARGGPESPALAPDDPLTLETPAPSRAAQRPTYVDGVDEPTPQQAAMLMSAAASAKDPGFSVIDWARERPVYVFAGAAFMFLAGYGAYVYIAITQPGLLSGGGFTKPAPGAPIGPLTAAPRPPAGAAPGNPGSPPAPATAPLLPDVTKPPPVMPATGAQVPVAGTAGSAATDPAAPPAAMSTRRQALAAPPAGPSELPVPAAPANPEPATRVEPRVPSSGIAGPVAVATPSDASSRNGRRRAAATAAAPASKLEVRASAGAAAITTQLNDAYAASLKGESHTAQDSYERVLAADPRNVDALLGLASIDWQAGKTEQASELYYRILQSEPQNAAAQAGLIGLVGRVDPVASETRLKLLIAREPAASLYFALGNLYSSQGQWAGAQRAYFQAVEADAGNPDYVFNLAVALEHIGQQKPALANYRKALDLSFARGSSFDQKQVIARIGQLSLAVE